MRSFIGGFGLVAALVASPALAQDEYDDRGPNTGPYVGVDIGLDLPGDYSTDIGGAVNTARTSNGLGWEAAALLGYDWGRFRTELEGNYRTWSADEIASPQVGLPQSATTLATGTFDYRGDIALKSVMANALVDFGDDDDAQFSLGAGVGRTWMDIDTTAATSGFNFLDTSDSEWAWQGIAQMRVPVSETVDVGVKYRYFSSLEFETADSLGRDIDFEVSSHSLSLGLTVMLGSRAAPPPPPLIPSPPVVETAPTPVAPPAPRGHPPGWGTDTSCNEGPYIVFFDWDESDVTPEAASVLNSAVSAYGNCGSARVMLAGHADRSGTQTYNEALSQRRNAAVQAYLSSRGIPAARITAEAFGESMSRVATADGVRELQNRRVEVTYGPGSGN